LTLTLSLADLNPSTNSLLADGGSASGRQVRTTLSSSRRHGCGRIGLGGTEAALIASEQRPLLERAFARHTLGEWKTFLDGLGPEEAMYQEVLYYQDILDDPQAHECGYIVERDLPGLGKKKQTENPVTPSKTLSRVGEPGGEIGQNNEEILLELGYDWDFISKLRSQTQAAR
jgi:hypothetical protein